MVARTFGPRSRIKLIYYTIYVIYHTKTMKSYITSYTPLCMMISQKLNSFFVMEWDLDFLFFDSYFYRNSAELVIGFLYFDLGIPGIEKDFNWTPHCHPTHDDKPFSKDANVRVIIDIRL